MRYFFPWEIVVVLFLIAWFLFYRHAVRLMNYYRELTDDLSELFSHAESILDGNEPNCPKQLYSEYFWVTYDPEHLERFFFALECVIYEINKTYDNLTGYCCYLGNNRWEQIKAMHAKTQTLEGRIRYWKWEAGFLESPQE